MEEKEKKQYISMILTLSLPELRDKMEHAIAKKVQLREELEEHRGVDVEKSEETAGKLNVLTEYIEIDRTIIRLHEILDKQNLHLKKDSVEIPTGTLFIFQASSVTTRYVVVFSYGDVILVPLSFWSYVRRYTEDWSRW